MNAPSMLLYEAGRRWSGLLRRTLQPCGIRVIQAGSLAACARQLLAGESRLAAIETQRAQLPAVLELASRAGRFAAPAGVIVLASRELKPLEGAMLEAGVLHCEFSIRNYQRVGVLIQRWLQEYSPTSDDLAAKTELQWPEPLAEVLAGWNAELPARNDTK